MHFLLTFTDVRDLFLPLVYANVSGFTHMLHVFLRMALLRESNAFIRAVSSSCRRLACVLWAGTVHGYCRRSAPHIWRGGMEEHHRKPGVSTAMTK